MPTLPFARTTVVDNAAASAGGLDVLCVVAPVLTNDDYTPHVFGSSADVITQHGYSEGAEFVSLFKNGTGKSVLFCGVPIETAGTVGGQNTSGNTGTSVVSVSTATGGSLTEHQGKVTVKRGGTVGTDQIELYLSLDGGFTTKAVRLGTATSYTIPYVGVILGLTVGTLVTGDVVLEWVGTGPLAAVAAIDTVRSKLAAQTKGFRSALWIGNIQSSANAATLIAAANAYQTSNDRFTRISGSVRDRLNLASLAQRQYVMTGAPSVTFAEVGATGDTITRNAGSWLDDGFRVGDTIVVAGTPSNNVTGVLAGVTATVLTLGSTDLVDEVVLSCSVTASPTITFAEVGSTGDTITRNRGSWVDDGFRSGCSISITGTASNNITNAPVTTVTPTVLTLGSTDLAAEAVGSYGVSVTSGETFPAYVATLEAAYASVDGEFRGMLGLGYARKTSPITGWYFRRPWIWAETIRNYQHDVHIASFRKSDGPLGWDLTDANGNLAEYDDRVYGGAATQAKFCSARTWSNGPGGAFVALNVTRGDSSSLLSLSHNVDVVNLACATAQLTTEEVVGRSLTLNDDGTATPQAVASIEAEVNAALRLALLADKGEGPRASSAVWVMSKTDVLNVPEASVTGVLILNLNGTIHSFVTSVRVISGGQE
jgi:hypothetical protein